MSRMTFEAFTANRRRVEDIAAACGFDSDETEARLPGYVYDNVLAVIIRDDGSYEAVMHNLDVTGRDLDAIERQLYDWAIEWDYI